MKKLLIFILAIISSYNAYSQTGICMSALSCNQTVTAHVGNNQSNVDFGYATSINSNKPQRYFCLGDPIELISTWNGTSLSSGIWQQLDASCPNLGLPAGSSLANAPVTWPSGQTVASSNQSKFVIPSQAGLYIFMFSGIIEGCLNAFDTAFVHVLPVPVANAGPSFLVCDNTAQSGYSYEQQLDAIPANTSIGEIGTWEWYPQSNFYIVPSEIHDYNATIYSASYVSGGIIRWVVTNTLTGCSSFDTLRLRIPNEGHVFASDDATICGNMVQRGSSSCGGNVGVNNTCISYPGYSSVYWNPTDPLDPNNTSGYTLLSPPIAYFWWEYVDNSYDPLPGGSPSTLPVGVEPTISNPSGEVVYITAALTGNPSPHAYYSGSYTFRYHVHGICLDGEDEVTFTFLSESGITTVGYFGPRTLCDTLQVFVGPEAAPGEYIQWIFDTTIAVVNGFQGQTTTQFWTSGTDTITLDFPNVSIPYIVTYRIYGADTASGCFHQNHFYILPDRNPAPRPWDNLTNAPIPPTSTSPYTVEIVLPCGQSQVTLPFRVINLLNNVYYAASTNFGPLAINNNLTYTGFTGSGTLPSSPILTNNILSGLTLPGTYHVTITSTGGCSHSNSAFIDIIVQMPSDGASAGSPVFLDCGINSLGLAANIPVVGLGEWSLVDFPSGASSFLSTYISSPNEFNNYALADNLDLPGTYAFQWEVSNAGCSGGIPYYDTIYIVVADETIDSTYAGPDTSYCTGEGVILTASESMGYWTSADTAIAFTNPNNNITTLVGLPTEITTVQTYVFIWHLLGACGAIADTVLITLDPGLCCLAATDSTYIHLPDSLIIDENTILTGQYYVEGIVYVTNNATLDITNVDLVFAECAGINFETGTTIRANNSVLRACNINDSWRGLQFANNTFGVIENCSFKNAIRAIDLKPGIITVRIFNNTFANNYIGIYAYATDLMEAITNNTFTIDNSFVDYYKGTCALPDTFDLAFFELPGYIGNYGILSGFSFYYGLITQNNFINGSDPGRNHLFYGIAGKSIYGTISNNNFTNMFRSIDIGISSGLTIFNNQIEIAINEEFSIEILRYATQIRLTESVFCKINGNKINSSILFNRLRFTMFELGALIYLENNTNTEVSDNVTNGAISAISLFNCEYTFIANNVLKQNYFSGIYAMLSKSTDISCNEIFMDSSLDGYNGYGITINDIDLEEQTSQSSIRNNCVFDAIVAITAEGISCQYKLPIIFNNFLYNYSYAGISVSGVGSIGTSTYPGRNTLISNNFNNGAVDIENTGTCIVAIAGNYGINYVSDSVTVVNTHPFNSSASCANQITEFGHFQFNQNLEMNELTDCKPYFDIRDSILIITNSSVTLSADFEQQIAKWQANEMVAKSAGVMNVLAANNNVQAVDKVYNIVSGSNKLNNHNLAWLNYYYKFAKADYQNAIIVLQNINAQSEMESNAKAYENIICNMLLNKTQAHLLNEATITQLKQLEANKDATSHKAGDLLRLAFGGYDYDFATVTLSTKPHSKKIKSLAHNAVSIFPNPATDLVTIDYVLQGETSGQLYVYDVNGSILMQKILPNHTAKTNLNIVDLTPGLYLLMIKQDDKMVHQTKLIKK